MRTWTCALLAGLLAGAMAASGPGGKVEYVGGTRADIPSGCTGKVQVIDPQYFVFYSGKASLRIPYEKINMLEYGQTVGRRVTMAVVISPLFMLAKKRAHFLTVDYTDESGREQALVFRVDKNAVRSILVSLEAKTGLKVQYQDDEARHGGKG
ncbi:MAG: hypothetical protein ACRD9L_19280 [Bryobacteraceae bacterium]